MPLELRLKGWRKLQGRKVPMTELEELRFLAKYVVRPGATPPQREIGRLAIQRIKDKYPGKGVMRPKVGEED